MREECFTIVTHQTPSRCHTFPAWSEDIIGLSQADRWHVGVQAGWSGQLDEGNVIVDGKAVPFGMGKDLTRNTIQLVCVCIFEGALKLTLLPWQASKFGPFHSTQSLCHVLQRPRGGKFWQETGNVSIRVKVYEVLSTLTRNLNKLKCILLTGDRSVTVVSYNNYIKLKSSKLNDQM